MANAATESTVEVMPVLVCEAPLAMAPAGTATVWADKAVVQAAVQAACVVTVAHTGVVMEVEVGTAAVEMAVGGKEVVGMVADATVAAAGSAKVARAVVRPVCLWVGQEAVMGPVVQTEAALVAFVYTG